MLTALSLPHELDDCAAALGQDPDSAPRVVRELAESLTRIRSSVDRSVWRSCVEQCQEHPLRALLHQDPLTERAFTKPRGYPGDAELLDLIYDKRPGLNGRAGVTPLGRRLFDYTIECEAPAAVRQRRGILGAELNRVCRRAADAKILSVACGHLREVALSQEVTAGNFGCLVALDQDSRSLEEVSSSLGHLAVEPHHGSVRSLIRGDLRERRFDFIYSAGLFDYLAQPLSRRLTRRLFELLEPGGELLIANYLPDIGDVGYMEAFMGWDLIYRSAAEIEDFTADLLPNEILDPSVVADAQGTVGYLRVVRK